MIPLILSILSKIFFASFLCDIFIRKWYYFILYWLYSANVVKI